MPSRTRAARKLASPLNDRHRRAIAWALLRKVWQSFDSGGESMRSPRSVALEMAMDLVRIEADIDVVIRAYEADANAFTELARQCRSCDQALGLVKHDLAEGINPYEGSMQAAELGIQSQREMIALLERHGWQNDAPRGRRG